MNVALDQTIILGRQIFLDHRSLSSIDQKMFIILPLPIEVATVINLSEASGWVADGLFIKFTLLVTGMPPPPFQS